MTTNSGKKRNIKRRTTKRKSQVHRRKQGNWDKIRKKIGKNIGRKLAKFLADPRGKIVCAVLIALLVIVCVVRVRSAIFDYKVEQITVTDLQECEDKQAYLDMVMPIYKHYCKKFHIKYPGILALQVFYEVGGDFPHELSDVATADNNLGGLKYAEGIPNATQGSECPENEGGYYCHFDTVGDYFYAQCWQVGQPLYDNVRNHQDSVEDFARTLCNLWIGGIEDSEPFGYSEELIADYQEYNLDQYEN